MVTVTFVLELPDISDAELGIHGGIVVPGEGVAVGQLIGRQSQHFGDAGVGAIHRPTQSLRGNDRHTRIRTCNRDRSIVDSRIALPDALIGSNSIGSIGSATDGDGHIRAGSTHISDAELGIHRLVVIPGEGVAVGQLVGRQTQHLCDTGVGAIDSPTQSLGGNDRSAIGADHLHGAIVDSGIALPRA